MMLYKKLVSEGTWPLTLSASVKGRSTAQQCQDRMSMTPYVYTKAVEYAAPVLQL